ncbi:MAG: hypothetical protein K6A40_04795 [Solobacterium sp.]|nr:hypothetical protein [Solobacterium sp.]
MNKRKLLKILKGSGLEYEIVCDARQYGETLFGRREKECFLFLAKEGNCLSAEKLAADAGLSDVKAEDLPKRWLRLAERDRLCVCIDRSLQDQKTALRLSDSEFLVMRTADLRDILKQCGIPTVYFLPHQII